MSKKIKDIVEEGSFKIIETKVSGKNVAFVTDKTKALYAEVEDDGIEEPEEFEENILDFSDDFKKVEYVGKKRRGEIQLYNVYITGVNQTF